MGTLIAGDAWLTTLSNKGGPSVAVAIKLLRMQMLTRRRTGHLVQLDTEYLRRRICASARWGHIAACHAQCSRCGTQATLANWVDAALLEPGEREERLKSWRACMPKELTAFLRECPGEEYAAMVRESEELPGG